ncbi:MAG: hypothetical protein RR137_03685 [Odoribacter sp.]
MKKFKLMSLVLSAFVAFTLGGCSDDSGEPTDGGIVSNGNLLFEGNVIGDGSQEFVFSGNQTLKKGTYYLKGWVYIREGAKLTIEAGSVIKGDKTTKAALIVERGGQLFAKGTASEPIVFTSAQPKGQRKPGDWGGLILCGKAKNNQGNDMQIEGGPRTHHGGNDNADNSGILSYVRIEFAGYPFEKDKEINALTLGSVGSGTIIDHVQVSYSNDDSYEWFGGSVNCKYLIAYKGWDDEFDTDNGFSGKVQFCLSVRDPRLADISQSNGFESDNCGDGAAVEPYTTAVFSNVTFIGPMGRDENFKNDETYINGGAYNPANGSGLGKFQAAMHIRRNSRLSCFNSVAVGFPIGLILDNEKGSTQKSATEGLLKLQHLYFAGMGITGSDANKIYQDKKVTYVNGKATVDANSTSSFSSDFFLNAAYQNRTTTIDALMLTGATEKIGVNYMPQAGSPLLSGASFSDRFLEGMQTVSYIGAFAAGDTWLNGWTNFDPQNTDY